jgi:hypothetical protein
MPAFADMIANIAIAKTAAKGHRLSWLATAVACCVTAASAQEAIRPTTTFQSRVDVEMEATESKSPSSGVLPGKDIALSVTPSWIIDSKGADTRIQGNWQFKFVDYLRDKQPDRVLPSGRIDARRMLGDKGLGIDGSLTASQVKNTPGTTASSSANYYTDTVYRLSPFWERDLDNVTRIEARLDRRIKHSSQLLANLAPRQDWHTREDGLKLTQRPTPFGYEVDYTLSEDRLADEADPALRKHQILYTALLAPSPEVNVGLTVGYARIRIGDDALSEAVHGARLLWRPTERSLVKAEVTDRFFGRSWKADISHRLRWLTFGFTTEREETTSADANQTPTTIQTNDVYSVTAQLRQANAARIVLMGRRNLLTFTGGVVRTSPLTIPGTAIAPSALDTSERYVSGQLNHRLTPFTTLIADLRLSRTRTAQAALAVVPVSRQWTWRTAVNTSLSSDTNATVGLRRQHTTNSTTPSNDETAAFVGLGHRF